MPRSSEQVQADRILIVEDEPTIRHVLDKCLRDNGYEVELAESAERALRLLRDEPLDVALVDIVLPGMTGLQLLKEIMRVSADTEVVIMTSHASLETAVGAIRQGAYDYLEKPFHDLEEVRITIERACEKRNLARNNRLLLQEQSNKNRELSAAVLRLTSLIDAGRAMGEYHSLSELLDFFIGLVALELNVDRASLMLLSREGSELRIAACRGFTDPDVGRVRVRLGEGVAGSVAQSGEPFLVPDTESDPRFREKTNPDLSHSFLSVPIVLSIPIKSREKVLGVINVTNRRSEEPFNEADLSYLSGLTGQLAVAIERARHFEELQQAYDSLKATQDQLVFSERNKAIGQMAAGVAHDFNNALSVILGRAEFGLRKLEGGKLEARTIRNDLESIKKAALQATETIKRIQEYTRIRRDLPYSEVELNAVVRDAVEINRPKWEAECELQGRRIDVRFDLREVPSVSGNFHELTQVVGNLIFNAVEAMPEGGCLTFRTYHEGPTVFLEVTDTGHGMSEETQKQLFEPFFTTKDSGQGLGTSIIYGIVARHQGAITVHSREGEGTTFRMALPRTRKGSHPLNDLLSPSDEAFQPARVLLVEDDPRVRETYEDVLASKGHEVAALGIGSDAVSLFGKRGFDLVITDLSMPGMSGLEVARSVKRLNPGVPVILISGWAIQQREEEIKEAGIDYVLDKPCPNDTLLAAVQQAVKTGRGIPIPAAAGES